MHGHCKKSGGRKVGMMIALYDASDYIVVQLADGRVPLNVLKLHKLLYYCQAWSLAFGRGRLFDGPFQAWVHGPVSRQIYDRYQAKSMYSAVSTDDIRPGFEPLTLVADDRALIDAVLESYASLTGGQLEEMTHREDPWIKARDGVPAAARSENIISEEVMSQFYAARLSN
jgi:uncharacterized phage-associated protein